MFKGLVIPMENEFGSVYGHTLAVFPDAEEIPSGISERLQARFVSADRFEEVRKDFQDTQFCDVWSQKHICEVADVLKAVELYQTL
jgi:hypothetical protein